MFAYFSYFGVGKLIFVLSAVSLTLAKNLSAVLLKPVNTFSAVSLTPANKFRLFDYF